jgi:hypothetical protein
MVMSEHVRMELRGSADLLKEDIAKDSANYRNDGCYATGKEIRIGAENVVTE